MRPFYYHHAPGQRFAFASDARALLVMPQVPHTINEGRIADFLVPELEWYDYESTFFEEVYRLPPGHQAVVTPAGLSVTEYYRVQPGPDLGPMSDDEYRDGFVEVFSKAIDARLSGPCSTVGSMLSGGIDSGSIVAFAKDLLEDSGNAPLPTFSGVRRLSSETEEEATWSETRSIHAAITMPSIAPTLVHPDDVNANFEPLSSGFEEPFDGVFTILKALFLSAHGLGVRSLLDGGGGDIVMNEGTYIVRLLRTGHFRRALAEIAGESHYSGTHSFPSGAIRYARNALLPDIVKRSARALRNRSRLKSFMQASLIAPGFAERIRVRERYEQMLAIFPGRWTPDYAVEFCNRIRPNMTGGRERYARIAASAGMEARDPYLDRRVVEYCARLPGRCKLRDGWPKAILRDVTAGKLPEEVRWSQRKQHLGYWFGDAVVRQAVARGDLDPSTLARQLYGYVDRNVLERAWQDFREGGNSEAIHYAFILAAWLRENQRRPVVPG
jgi:asparagine synthase (glutamine-hydrolysing)